MLWRGVAWRGETWVVRRGEACLASCGWRGMAGEAWRRVAWCGWRGVGKQGVIGKALRSEAWRSDGEAKAKLRVWCSDDLSLVFLGKYCKIWEKCCRFFFGYMQDFCSLTGNALEFFVW